jgi:CTP-dependent riboflavin kinase
MVRMTGIIFSDLGQAASFMALEWVQAALNQRLGFSPFPATLNVRPKGVEDAEVWRGMREHSAGLALTSANDGFCNARLYPIELVVQASVAKQDKISGAILVPEVKNYPNDKIEIVAPVRLKEHLGVEDGDQLTWEFLN